MKTRTLAIGYLVLVTAMLGLSGCGSSDTSSEADTETNTTTNSTVNTDYEETYSDSNFTAVDWSEATHSKSADPDFDEVFVDTEVKRLDFVVSAERWQSMLDNMTDIYGTFGSTSVQSNIPTGAPEGAPIGGPGSQTTTTTSTLVDTDEDPIFVPADVYYNGREWYRVGIRFKGNSSLQTSWESGILKLAFKLDFDEFEDQYPQIDNQRFYGFKKFSLKNNFDDSSFVREKVAADVFKDAGLAVSHTAFYTLYVDHGNGPEYFGLYTLVEEVDGTVLDDQFISDDGNLYKPEDGSANFVEGTFNEDDFTKKTNEDDADWSDIEALFTALHDESRTTDAASWRNNLEDVFDVDTFLKYLAVNGIIQNWDTYGLMTHNFYLYNNPQNNKLTWIPWDNNEALQEGKQGGALDLDFSDLEANNWPLIEKIYADATYKAQYDTYVQETIDSAFETTSMEVKYETYSDLIEEYATSEIEGYSFINNSSEFSNAISDLKQHASERTTAAESYLNK